MRDESLNLEVRDFGPIGQARVELRPLTVFVGPSNTGKSYLAMLIYALHKHFSKFDSNSWWHAEQIVRRMLRDYGEQLARDVRKTRESWNKEDEEKRSPSSSLDVLQARTWTLSNAFKKLVGGAISTQGAMLRMEIERCFGSRIEELTMRSEGSNFAVGVYRQIKQTNGDNPKVIKLNYSNATLTASIPNEIGINLTGGKKRFAELELELERYNAIKNNEPELARIFEFPVLRRVLQEIAFPGLFNQLGFPGHYLPAGRAELLDSYDAIVESLIDQASTLSAVPPSIAGVKVDFLRQLLGLARLDSQTRNSSPSEIEEEILKGLIFINTVEEVQFPRFSYKPTNWIGQDLPLKNASSMVSEVAPISLYEKHVLKRGELLIVDEPESHLHPELQVKLFRQLARLVNEGKRVLVTTHSEWVAEELSNIVRRSMLEGRYSRVAESKPTMDDVSIPEDDVGVWQFSKKGQSGSSTVKKIDIGETGLYDTGFDDVAIQSHNEWVRITNAIEEN